MTAASVNVNINLALPQGWTGEQIQEHIVDLLAEHIAPVEGVVEFEVVNIRVNADPLFNAPLLQW